KRDWSSDVCSSDLGYQGLAALDLAPADQHARGAAAVVAAGCGGAARCLLPAARRRPTTGHTVLHRPPGPGAGAGQPAPVRRLHLTLVLRRLPAAVHLPHRLHRPAHLLTPEEPAQQPDPGTAQVLPVPGTYPAAHHLIGA